jgi:acyl carrier protein
MSKPQLTPEQIHDKVAKIIEPLVGYEADEIAPDLRFQEDLELTRSNVMDVLVEIEEEFGIWINDEDHDSYDGLKTVGDVEKLVAAKLEGKK